jgi:hypothetical protein
MTSEQMALSALGSAVEQAIYILAAVIFLAYLGRWGYRLFQEFLDGAANHVR